ncbi:ShlB/FhaC/HecB family hemolysin secretion/activation protein [Phyllobacterium sp. YR531]|uniref:ShlB/FhaC/HecB family hemolysin secretion/activation protein n=1 Tax=Phyllobacterium sp. YR531 TaxID=1144343 RepID=UPI00026F5BA0|nr:ShlB/FhaC/HecB family hemolysin secretion/activation protein [Phyllobacterium sp. YR531]EJN02510.1 hemolysin activation/secretion protein [Phyllobacterium sp. YR531]
MKLHHTCATFTLGIVLPVLTVGAAFSQSPADDFARRQAEQEQAIRLETLKRQTPDSGPALAPQSGSQVSASGLTTAGETPADGTPSTEKGHCFQIQRVVVEGVKQFAPKAIDTVTKPYENKCVGLAEINTLMRDLTYVYLDKGYITSRAYVPEQDIAGTKTLRLIVVEGILSDVYLNGAPLEKYKGVLTTAFPGMKGGIANIRDIEQGLDQINRLASNNAKSAMLPGKADGTSILNVENKSDLIPWHFSIANSNLGQKQTGYSKSSVSFRMDNLFSLNDLIAFSYDHTGPDYPWANDGIWGDDEKGKSNSYSGSISIPYGYSTFSLNGSWYEYDSEVAGNFGPIKTSGDSKQLGLGIDRVVGRDKDSITTVHTGLTYKTTNNFLLGSKIEVGSREYTVGSLGISHSRRMFGGLWAFDASYEQGLDIFGSVQPGEPGAGNADPTFAKFNATVNATKPFELAKQHFEISSVLSGQYTPDNLFGAEQISLGSYSNVRGSRDSLLFGNNGFFSRNELTWRSMPWSSNALLTKRLGEFRPYVGLDYGHVYAQERYGMPGGDMTSWSAGVRLAGGNISADVGYSGILETTADTDHSGLFYFSTSVRW